MAEERVRRRLAAILTADVVGYSRLMGEDEEGTRIRFNDQFDTVVQPAIREHRVPLAVRARLLRNPQSSAGFQQCDAKLAPQ